MQSDANRPRQQPQTGQRRMQSTRIAEHKNEQIKINGTLQPSSYATKEKRRKHWVKFFAHAVERQLIDSNPILKLELLSLRAKLETG